MEDEQIHEIPVTPDEPAQPEVDELALARELVLKAYPQIVPEMVAGESLTELLASVPTAAAAYQRIAEQTAAATVVPAGAGVRSQELSLEGFSPLAKIRAGLARS